MMEKTSKPLWMHVFNYTGILIVFWLLYIVHPYALLGGILVYIYGIYIYFRDKKAYENQLENTNDIHEIENDNK